MITRERIKKEMIDYCYQNNISLRNLAEKLNISPSNFFLVSSNKRELSDKVILLLIKYWSKKKETLKLKKKIQEKKEKSVLLNELVI